MGNNLSVEEKLYKCARDSDAVQLQSIIHQLHRQGAQLSRYLEAPDSTGQTALIVAAARGNYDCAEILLKHGANLHHFSQRPEGTTALHESVQRGHMRIVELLLQYGANPFIENARGLTSVDIAINKGNVSMVRVLELRSHFTGSLQLKVPKFMGLGTEWKSRWMVVMPRYQFPSAQISPQDRVARSLLVCYRGSDQVVPVCKVWLDGAVARSVIGSKGSGMLQCALSLHKNHAMANGAFMTGDPSIGYTMHLRPADGTAQGAHALKRFMDIVNGSSSRPATQTPPSSPQRPPPAASSSRPQVPAARPSQATTQHQHRESDEDIARKLQQKYDAEMAEYIRQNPGAAKARLSSSSAPALQSHSTSGTTTPVQASSSFTNHSPQASLGLNTRPSAPMYPTINPASPSSSGNPFGPPAFPAGQAPRANGQSASGSPEWCMTLPAAPAPPASATRPPSDPTQTTSAAVEAAAKVENDNEAEQCVICLAAPASAGFLHGESVHKCCCRDCALDVKKAKLPTCPMCREPIEHVILNFY